MVVYLESEFFLSKDFVDYVQGLWHRLNEFLPVREKNKMIHLAERKAGLVASLLKYKYGYNVVDNEKRQKVLHTAVTACYILQVFTELNQLNLKYEFPSEMSESHIDAVWVREDRIFGIPSENDEQVFRNLKTSFYVLRERSDEELHKEIIDEFSSKKRPFYYDPSILEQTIQELYK